MEAIDSVDITENLELPNNEKCGFSCSSGEFQLYHYNNDVSDVIEHEREPAEDERESPCHENFNSTLPVNACEDSSCTRRDCRTEHGDPIIDNCVEKFVSYEDTSSNSSLNAVKNFSDVFKPDELCMADDTSIESVLCENTLNNDSSLDENDGNCRPVSETKMPKASKESNKKRMSSEDTPRNCSRNCVEDSETVGPDDEKSTSLSADHSSDDLSSNCRIKRSRYSVVQKEKKKEHERRFKSVRKKCSLYINYVDSPDESAVPNTKAKSRVREKRYACVICGKRFVSENILKSHVHSHGGNKRFKCELCGKEYGWQSSYQNHMATHSGGEMHKCSTCGKILCNNATLQRHIERMHLKPAKNFLCDLCNRSFLYKYELKYHKENHFTKRQFICEFCGKIVSTKNDLVSHVRTHTGEKPFVCNICNKGFTWKSLMKQHMMLHIDGNSFQCEVCGKQYSAQRSLARHARLHAEDRPYKCNICSKTFRSPSAMASHKDFHLGVKRHKCEFCGKAFLSDSNMHKHKKRHLGIKNQSCEICNKAFITKQELQMHMRSHYRGDNNSSKGRRKNNCSIKASSL